MGGTTSVMIVIVMVNTRSLNEVVMVSVTGVVWSTGPTTLRRVLDRLLTVMMVVNSFC